jgi:4-azaleucine resistance transporter AzlC
MTVAPLFDTRDSRDTRPGPPSLPLWVDVRNGIVRALPMILGYVPLGFTFGVVALSAGLTSLQALLMSTFVYAASSQLLAVQLLAADASVLSVVATVCVCNLRHLLMSSALAPYLRRYRPAQIGLFAFQLCDEAFALHSEQFANRQVPRIEALASNMALHLALVGGTALAMVSHASASDLQRYGLDYAPVAMFVAMMVLLIKDRLQLGVALLCGIMAVLLRHTFVGTSSIIVATGVGATLGTWVQLRHEKRDVADGS